MITIKNIKCLLETITENLETNIKNINTAFGNLNYKDNENQTILHILVDNLYDETKCFLAIKSLLKFGMNPNLESDFHYNFIQIALYTGYSEDFILKIIKESLKYHLNVNHVDSDKDTIMHTAIYSDNYLYEIENIYNLLCNNGFDSTKLDQDNRNLIEAMIYQKQYTDYQIEKFKKVFYQNFNNKVKNIAKKEITISTILKEKIIELEKYGKVLNKKKYFTNPTIGREKEFKSLLIALAQEKKNPLIVGESGVGKTALIEELAYQIQNYQVPKFLQEKIILEINPSEVVAGCQYVGTFEDKMTKLLKLCEENDVIIFIDEIHTIYGIGSSHGKNNDMAAMLKYYLDRSNLKVIGTTTLEEYNLYFKENALKRRFEKIIIQEPKEDVLYQIINKVIEDYQMKNGYFFEKKEEQEHIIKTIIFATEKENRIYNDIINNPDLAISIIDKAFALAKITDSNNINYTHFIESFKYCDRLYNSIVEQTISKLRNYCDQSTTSKIRKLNKK